MKTSLLETVTVGNRLGEGVVWDAESESVWWTDILAKKLYAYRLKDKRLTIWDTPEMLACFALIEGRSDLLAGFESGFAYFQPDSGRVEWICKIESNNSKSRLNDGRTDRQGRFWVGTMSPDATCNQELGSLYSLDAKHQVRQYLTGIKISNSLCWSPDSSFLYHSDTPTRSIQRYAFDPINMELGEAEPFIETEPNCYPDGSIVDADGFLLNAQWGGSKVVRYSPEGNVDTELRLPVSQPTCVAIGGRDYNLLFVSSAKEALQTNESEAGNLFIYQTDLLGLPEARYKV